MLHEIRLLMEKNKYLKKLAAVILETKFIQYRRRFIQYKRQFIHDKEYDRKRLSRDIERKETFRICYELYRSEFEKVAELLEDDFSRKTLRTVIEYRLSPCKKTLLPILVGPQYFPRDIIRKKEELIFIDGGGYDGDTIISLAVFWGKNKWKKIYSWEPDEINRKKLIENCKKYGFENVEILPFALWSEKKELHFNMAGKEWSRISDRNPETVVVDSIDNICSKDKVTFIKMDIEGSELEALRGAEKVIRRDKPDLAISIYHKPEDYFQIPFFIKQLVPEYKLYIRHHKPNKDDTVLYAVL